MSDLGQLERFTDNFIIDELSWHINNRGIPKAIEPDYSNIDKPMVVFRFASGQAWTQEIDPGFFVDHWHDAAKVLVDFPEIPQLSCLPDQLITQFGPFRKKHEAGLAEWRAATKQDSEQAVPPNGP